MGLIEWVRPSFEGKNRTASSRRVTTFWFVMIETVVNLVIIGSCIYLVKSTEQKPQGISAVEQLIWFSIISRVSIFLLMSIVTWQNINDSIKAVGNLKSKLISSRTETSEVEVTETTTEEQKEELS